MRVQEWMACFGAAGGHDMKLCYQTRAVSI